MSAWVGRSSHGEAAAKIVPPDPRILDTGAVDSLKALDLDRPVREADIQLWV
jgi:hypothetical protein